MALANTHHSAQPLKTRTSCIQTIQQVATSQFVAGRNLIFGRMFLGVDMTRLKYLQQRTVDCRDDFEKIAEHFFFGAKVACCGL
jgi:hypothetical protein